MKRIEKAIETAIILIETGMSLSEAIKETASEFGLFEAELWNEF
jgi:hypothetical protein